MKKHFIAAIIASLLISPMAIASGAYGGLSFGQVEISKDIEVDTGNLGLILGDINESGFGFEFLYSLTLLDDEEGDIAAETDTLGLFAVFQTPGDVYFKAKAGYGIVNLKFDDFDNNDSVSDTSEGFSYGLALGTKIGDGRIELSYYRFADFDDYADIEDQIEDALVGSAFEGTDIDIEAEVEMINLSYIFTF